MIVLAHFDMVGVEAESLCRGRRRSADGVGFHRRSSRWIGFPAGFLAGVGQKESHGGHGLPNDTLLTEAILADQIECLKRHRPLFAKAAQNVLVVAHYPVFFNLLDAEGIEIQRQSA